MKYLPVGTEVIVTWNGKEYKGKIAKTKGCSCLVEFYGSFRVKETPTFKVGDKVRLKEKYYDEPEFEKRIRSSRKCLSFMSRNVLTVKRIYENGMIRAAEDHCCLYHPSLLELAEKPVVEVKRAAKVGEWVKITDAKLAIGHYHNGEVLLVKSVSESSNVWVQTKRPRVERCLWVSEYVVLENYVPKLDAKDNAEIQKRCIKIIADACADATSSMSALHHVFSDSHACAKKIEPKIGMWAKRIGGTVGTISRGGIYQIVNVYSAGGVSLRVDGGNAEYCFAKYLELLPDYKPMRHWTEAEITEAKCIIAELLFNKTRTFTTTGINEVQSGDQLKAAVYGKTYTATCRPTDEWNYWIGRMVSMCKAHGRELPEWMYKEESK
jgi:hypothetical protein